MNTDWPRRVFFGTVLSLLVFLALHEARADTNVFAIIPAGTTNLVGDTIQLMVQENGGAVDPSFGFQWSRNGTNLVDADNITGSQTSTLTISNAQLTDAAVYSVTISVTGSVESVVSAPVYVLAFPVIESVTATTTGAAVTFTVVATGGLLSYQWLWQGQPLASATNSTLSFANAYTGASAGFYSVLVTNLLGGTNSSLPGLLFTKPVPAGVYQGLFYDTNALADSSGFFQFTLASSTRSFSGRITLGTKSYPFSGAFSAAHATQINVLRPGGTPLTLQLQLITINDLPEVSGTLSSGDWTALLSGHRLFFNSHNLAPFAGKFTLSLENTNTSRVVPDGAGYGFALISKYGVVTMTGKTGDGISVAQSCGLSRLGDWPFHVSFLQGRGRMLGWLRVQPRAASSIQGTNVLWFKTPGPDILYPDGYSISLQPAGSSYNSTNNLFSFTNGVATLSGGDLYLGDTPVWDFVRVSVRPPSALIPEQGVENLHLSVNRGNGTLAGQFIDFATGLRASFRAIVLQQQNYATGYFLSTNASGHFALSSGQ